MGGSGNTFAKRVPRLPQRGRGGRNPEAGAEGAREGRKRKTLRLQPPDCDLGAEATMMPLHEDLCDGKMFAERLPLVFKRIGLVEM